MGRGDAIVTIEIHPITGIPDVHPGDDLVAVLSAALRRLDGGALPGDVLVVTHKIVSKAEGAIVDIAEDDDARYRAAVEAEAVAILRRRGDLVIAKTRHGFICANAGVDRSNTERGTAILLPSDPDRSAHSLRMGLKASLGTDLAVVVTDTFGRAWRRGLTDVAIGVSGIDAIADLRGTTDAQGRVLEVTEIAIADEIAAAADLAMGKARGIPAALVRGLGLPHGEGRAADLVRGPDEDLFR
jgi:coenzyme F420-0:L-glutamate ligase/coenzyme F420-1:gamma-L-glutamate ligase